VLATLLSPSTSSSRFALPEMTLHDLIGSEDDGVFSFQDYGTKHSDGVSGYPMALGIEPRI
jgi:hypothetical protein